MECPAVQYGNDMHKANMLRQDELLEQIRNAGVIDAFLEYIRIDREPNKSYSERFKLKVKHEHLS